jgi:hypothetical protein
MRQLFALIILATGTIAQAAPVTIGFDGGPTYFGLETYGEDGFTLTSNVPDGTLIDNDNLVRGNLGSPGTGTNSQALFWGQNATTSTITLADNLGGVFNLVSFDASSLANAAGSLSVVGTLFGGGTVSQVLTLSSSLSTYNVTGLDNLVSVAFSFNGATSVSPYDMDNINLNVVPVPAAVWLFGSALGLMGWVRRRAAGRLPA